MRKVLRTADCREKSGEVRRSHGKAGKARGEFADMI